MLYSFFCYVLFFLLNISRIGNPMMRNFAQIIVDVPDPNFAILFTQNDDHQLSILEWFLSTKMKRQFA